MWIAAATWLFWLSVATLVYAYLGFPLLVGAVGLFKRQVVRKGDITPRMTLIIAAYNEAREIGERLDNALASDYPMEQLQIIVASDGSNDGTNEIVERYRDRGVVLLALPRRGKIHALNAAAAAADGEILVFSDANIVCAPNALRVLASNFADPSVGGAAGHTSYRTQHSTESTGEGEKLYFSYDSWLKLLESQTGSIVSAHGAFYAIRRSLYQPVQDAGVTDDFAISTLVIEGQQRLVYEPAARATEFTTPTARREFNRRVRLMTRGLRGVVLRRRLLNPLRHGFYSVVLWSHKVVRRLTPLALLGVAVASTFLWHTAPLYALVFAAQTAFYGLALLGLALRRLPTGRARVLMVPFYYCMANTACAVALYQLVRGTRIELWQPQRLC